ncbi:hypothetical protein KC345_g8688 [Hortaea werneckii]|nr:hypothetical protein KC345_g8688 [Hortaea werneckii]
MKLSILDQSPVSDGSTPAEALAQTAELAREAERLGYHRFWVAEHHAAPGLAGSSPEVLMAHLAAVTSVIRIGSGAVLLPHYSAYKVAENFRVLEALYPGRIDLGVGRAAGGGALAAKALQDNRVNPEGADRYEEQLKELIAFLHDSESGGGSHRYAGLHAAPAVRTAPEIWLLGSGRDSAALSARLGTGYAFAQFINGNGGAEAVREYTNSFALSRAGAAPRSLVAVFAVCAGTSAEADRLAASMDLSLVLLEKGHLSTATPSVDTALKYTYTPYDRFSIKDNRKRMVVGSPGEVKEQLLLLAEQYQCGELMLSSHIHSFEDKLESLRLIAEACGLPRRDFAGITPSGTEVPFKDYEGKVLLIANTASKCGLTPQYGDLQKLYEQYGDQGLVVLGFPCNQFAGQEPGTSEEAEAFCQINYGVTFPVFAKVDVNGPEASLLFQYLKGQQPGDGESSDIQWNFTKFLVDRSGNVVARVEPKESPDSMKERIESLLQ